MVNDDRLNLKCTTDEKAAWKRAAGLDNRALSNWIKLVLNQAAEEALRKNDQNDPAAQDGKKKR